MIRRLSTLLLAGMLAFSALACLPLSACAVETPVIKENRAEADFYLKEGDRVVFYGDSITDQRLYTTYIESYCLVHFPNRKITFVHSGWGGDRVTGGGGGPIDVRLKRDVIAYKPTVVTICLGMNDGGYRNFDQGLYDTYVSGYRHILETLKKELPGVRITLLTAPAFDDVTRQPNFTPGYNSILVTYGKAVAELGKEFGLLVADTNAPLVAAMQKAQALDADLSPKIIPDRVHPGPGGHMIMAAAVLKAWKAPELATDIEINAKSRKLVRQTNTKVTGLKVDKEKITFTHLDRALPWPLDRDPEKNKDMGLAVTVTDYEQTLNRHVLKITGLPAGRYMLKVDGNDVDELTSDELNEGFNLLSLPKLPSNLQAQEVLNLTKKHNNLHFQRWRQVQFPHARNGEDVEEEVKKQMDDLDLQETEAVKEQIAAAQPKTHTVELEAVKPSTP